MAFKLAVVRSKAIILIVVDLLFEFAPIISLTENLSKTNHFQKDLKLVFKTNYRLMHVNSITECSNAILSTFTKLPFVINICV